VLDIGLGEDSVEGLARWSGDRRFALDAQRRLLAMYGDIVMGVARGRFEERLAGLKSRLGDPRMPDAELDANALEALAADYRRLILDVTGAPFPEDPHEQLWGAIGAVFRSWNNPRASRYRRAHGIDADAGTACTVQAMVFGNLGKDSGTGVVSTRHPSTGAKTLYGEFLACAQGEDVVDGARTPSALTADAAAPGCEERSLERALPKAFAELTDACALLEQGFGDMQDVEFTVERGKTFILQTRRARRSARAAVRIAVEMVGEGLLDRDGALTIVDAGTLDQLLHATLPSPEALAEKGIVALARGLPASPGAATGHIVFRADDAARLRAEGQDVVLVRRETGPEDIHGMKAAEGVVTATGGMTSHAAVVARGLGRCCVAGCSDLTVDYAAETLTISRRGATPVTFHRGDVITLDGTHGTVYEGALDVVAAATVPELDTLLEWADARRRLRVRANADTPRAARLARAYGAEGIGLCRTEHMFFAEERLLAMRCLVLAENDEARARWGAAIEPMQRGDFSEIFRAMDGFPVTVRLLDWPLHEFMPRGDDEIAEIARELGIHAAEVGRRCRVMTEANPMIGHRGVRVGLTRPDIYRTQVRAILGAALDCAEDGITVHPELLVPVVALAEEVAAMRRILDAEARALFEARGRAVPYRVGTMIELPRACLVADRLAETAEFFSFGTNDLTQTTLGISRDDASHFLSAYVDDLDLIRSDPFDQLDREGVGQLIEIACAKGRSARGDLEIGVCGEQGAHPQSIDFFDGLGFDYVSCSPPRLPIVRVAAAQAAIREGRR